MLVQLEQFCLVLYIELDYRNLCEMIELDVVTELDFELNDL